MTTLQLRPATQNDSAILLQWRNDEATRIASRNRDLVEEHEHAAWFSNSLANDQRQILIAEFENKLIGTIRLDRDDKNGETEVSWTVSPDFRGQGWGKAIVKTIVDSITGKLVAYIREGNIASQKIALTVGFTESFANEKDEMLRFELNR